MGTLRGLLRAPDVAAGFQGGISMSFHGYDMDPRPLWEIPEVRSFVRQLDDAFPHWLYFANFDLPWFPTIWLCLLPAFLTPAQKASAFPAGVDELLRTRWWPAMNSLGDWVGLTPEENVALTNEVAAGIRRGLYA